ncbi:MAG: hypothetical protein HRK26_03785 [Rickettsiaceae bacterium H1]|nr:hypothetical protein [Rickettsiaceae bacterium H1]
MWQIFVYTKESGLEALNNTNLNGIITLTIGDIFLLKSQDVNINQKNNVLYIKQGISITKLSFSGEIKECECELNGSSSEIPIPIKNIGRYKHEEEINEKCKDKNSKEVAQYIKNNYDISNAVTDSLPIDNNTATTTYKVKVLVSIAYTFCAVGIGLSIYGWIESEKAGLIIGLGTLLIGLVVGLAACFEKSVDNFTTLSKAEQLKTSEILSRRN